MPIYGCFRMLVGEPDRTWAADFIEAKGGQILFWTGCLEDCKSKTLVGVVRLEPGQTVVQLESTKVESKSVYRTAFDGKEQPEVHRY